MKSARRLRLVTASDQKATTAPERLTVARIEALRPIPGSQYVKWDADPKGFGVRVSGNGAKSYVLKYRMKSGRVRWKSYGRIDDTPLPKARDLARHDRGEVAAGRDPLQQIDQSKGAPTVASVAAIFRDEHVSRKKASTQRLYTLALDAHILPMLGAIAIADLTDEDVRRLHHRLRDRPYMANRCLAVVSKLCAWAEKRRYRVKATNPCLGMKDEKYREVKRRRYLTPAELARLGAALRVAERRKAVSPSSLTIIKLLILTGARVSEITSLQRTHVDLKRGVLNLPDSKTGAKTILLSAPAAALLETWPRFAKSPHVFPGEGRGDHKGQHRVTLTDAWRWLRTRAKIPDVRLHDLRHSFASVAVSGGLSLPMIGGLLGHSQPATTARYAHLQDSPLRAASEATAGTIAAALGRRRAVQ